MSETTAETTAEPIAVVGMACRLPGDVNGPDELWELLVAGRDAVGELPAQRWAAYAGQAAALRGVTRRGAFLADPAGFDAEFFGVTPREAELIDPQQRITLELSWEALEHAGIDPRALAGTDAGVYMGVGSDDYGRQMLEDLPRIEAWTGIGASPCAVANRVSYSLDLRGPSLVVDTACSSSLVAVHLACAALRDGECSVALAGGVNVMAGPGLTMVLDRAGATSPHGRSRPFDAAADGYGRGEGAGVVVLKRLADAVAAGDPVLALVRGSAVRQDGRTAGIMAPSGAAQRDVARSALERGAVDPATVAYVEAHGTGTAAGDPVEAAALSAVYGRDRPADAPCLLGSLKGNIGHLEAGAGVAGMIKAVLALGHGVIPPQAGGTAPTPAVAWADAGLQVVTAATPWPAGPGPRRAGVSAFGYGGTVSHVVLEQAPAPIPTSVAARSAGPTARVFPLSGVSDTAVRASAASLADHVVADGHLDDAALAAVADTLWRRRAHLPHRAAVVAADAAALRHELRRVVADQPSPDVRTGSVLADAPADPVWVFGGHGAQWPGMGAELLADPAFSAVVDRIEPIFLAEAGFSARQALASGEHGDVGRVQALLFVVQCGLAATWRALGVRPAAVIGHSVGEVAAAVTAGRLDLDDGARLICRRSALVRRAAGAGAMVLVGLGLDEVVERLGDATDVVAAIEPSYSSTVLSGTPEAVRAVAERLAADDVVVRPVASDVAFHSPQMDPLLADLRAALADLTPAAGTVPCYSTALPDPRSDAPRDAAYWAANLRDRVRLAPAVAAAAADGHRHFLELSAHPVVTHSIADTLRSVGRTDVVVVGSLRRGQPERHTLLLALAALHCHGARVDPAVQAPGGGLAALPRIAWQHRPFWRTAPAAGGTGGHDPDAASLLGAPLSVAAAGGTRIWRTRVDDASRPYPGRHPVHGVEIVPAAVHLGTLLAAAGTHALADVVLGAPLDLREPREVQVVAADGVVTVLSGPACDGPVDPSVDPVWTTHVTGRAVAPTTQAWPVDGVAARCPDVLAPGSVRERLAATGIATAAFDWSVRDVRAGAGELLVRVGPVAAGTDTTAAWAELVDAALSAAPLLFGGEPVLRIVDRIGRVELGEPPADPLLHLVRTADGLVDVLVADADGARAGTLGGVRLRTLDGEGLGARRAGLVHRTVWSPTARRSRPQPLRRILLVGADDAFAAGVRAEAGAAEVVALSDVEQAGRTDADDRDVVVLVPDAAPPQDAPVRARCDAAVTAAWGPGRAAALLAAWTRRPPQLWVVTVGVREGGAPEQAVRWGIGRVLGGEHPDVVGGVVDLAGPQAAADLMAVLTTLGPADVYAPRAGRVEAARLVPLDGPAQRPALRCRPDGTYLVTGGLGALGLRVAAWLADRGARRLVLTGRTPVPPRSAWPGSTDPRVLALRALEERGVSVATPVLDVTDAAASAAALAPEALGMPPIRGVVHAAGVLADATVTDLTRDALATVLEPKVAGTLVLDALFPAGSLDFLTLFSSFGQFLGLTGQAGYAAANAFLDGFAAGRADTQSLCWSSWHGLGMAASDVVDGELRHAGVTAISADEAFHAWDVASRHRLPTAVVFGVAPGARPRLPVFAELRDPAAELAEAEPDVLAGLGGDERAARLVDEVAGQVAAEIRMPVDELDVHRPLTQLGLDSVLALSIRRRLEARFRTDLPATLLWKWPTVADVAGHLDDVLAEPAAR